MPISIDMKNHHPITTTGKVRVMDCVQAAGFNMSQWKYPDRYEWAQAEPPSNLYLFNLWDTEISVEDGVIMCCPNWRKVHEEAKALGRWKQQYKADRTDRFACAAHHRGSPVRVVVVNGYEKDNGHRVVTNRNLDPVAWRVVQYSMSSGQMRIRRESVH